MPTVLRLNGYRFYFFASEGSEPPHVHVDKGAGTLKLWIEELNIAYVEDLKPSEIREILIIARSHRQHLLDAWNEFDARKN
jgi:hypothetical protein